MCFFHFSPYIYELIVKEKMPTSLIWHLIQDAAMIQTSAITHSWHIFIEITFIPFLIIVFTPLSYSSLPYTSTTFNSNFHFSYSYSSHLFISTTPYLFFTIFITIMFIVITLIFIVHTFFLNSFWRFFQHWWKSTLCLIFAKHCRN